MLLTIGPNPTLIRLDVPRRILQKTGESRRDYLRKAGRLARRVLRQLLAMDEYRYCHRSFAVRDAMLVVEMARPDIGTFGVEGIAKGSNSRSPAIDYLNAGDTYAETLLYVRCQFRIGNWGDIVERGNYA